MRAPSIPIAAPLSISLVLALQGCASTKEDIFPSDMRPMSEVYDRHFAKLRMRGIEGARGNCTASAGRRLQRPPAQRTLPHRCNLLPVDRRIPSWPATRARHTTRSRLAFRCSPIPSSSYTSIPISGRTAHRCRAMPRPSRSTSASSMRYRGRSDEHNRMHIQLSNSSFRHGLPESRPRDGDTKSCHKSHQPE